MRAVQLFFFSILTVSTAVTAYGLRTVDWDAAYTTASAALQKLDQTAKVGIVTGVTWEGGPCVGNTYKATSINFPSLCLQDSPLGIRNANPVTAFPAGINTGATWDRKLMYERGAALEPKRRVSASMSNSGRWQVRLERILTVVEIGRASRRSLPQWSCHGRNCARHARLWCSGLCQSMQSALSRTVLCLSDSIFTVALAGKRTGAQPRNHELQYWRSSGT